MKKNSLLNLIFGLGIIVVLVTTSCLKTTTTDETTYYYRLGTLLPNGSSHKIMLDDSIMLYPAAYSYGTITDSSRVYVVYTINSEVKEKNKTNYNITISTLSKITVKKPKLFTKTNVDSIGHDPINVQAIWTGLKYLNLNVQIYGSSTTLPHSLTMVEDSIHSTSVDTVRLLLRHNASGDTPATASTGILCFDMSKYLRKGKPVILNIKYTNYRNIENKVNIGYTTDSAFIFSNGEYAQIKLNNIIK